MGNIDKYTEKYRNLNSKKSNSICIHQHCDKKAINSHCFSKTSMLKKIAIAGKLRTDDFKINDKGMSKEIVFKEIGIHEASTFKGFCHEHDSLFSSIDRYGITTLKDIFLQLYRSMSKIWFTYNILTICEKETLGVNTCHNSNYQNNKVINDTQMRDLFADLSIDVPTLNSPLTLCSNFALKMNPYQSEEFTKAKVLVKKLDFFVPAIFQNYLCLKKDGHYIDYLFIVIPFENTSLIIAASDNDTIEWINSKLKTKISSLNFIELMFMMNSNFYLSPKIFNEWPDERREIIISDYRYHNELNINYDYDISLFDDIRKELIKNELPSIIEKEERKLTSLPLREDTLIREKRMQVRHSNDFRNQLNI